jgi:PhoH-like ATPase
MRWFASVWEPHVVTRSSASVQSNARSITAASTDPALRTTASDPEAADKAFTTRPGTEPSGSAPPGSVPVDAGEEPSRSRLTYVIDTSVLLSDPWALNRFEEHEVILPLVVIGELEAKRHHPELGYFARQALRILD